MRSLVLPAVAALLACAAHALAPAIDLTDPVILADDASQDLFDSALEWSRANHLETGGCFKLFSAVANKIIIIEAEEKVNWRRTDRVEVSCRLSLGMWHTHWEKENASSVGCNTARGQDIYLIEPERPLGLVICGVGRDSIIPYTYSAKADSNQKAYRRDNPAVKQAEDSIQKEMTQYTCANEPKVSLERGVNCHG